MVELALPLLDNILGPPNAKRDGTILVAGMSDMMTATVEVEDTTIDETVDTMIGRLRLVVMIDTDTPPPCVEVNAIATTIAVIMTVLLDVKIGIMTVGIKMMASRAR